MHNLYWLNTEEQPPTARYWSAIVQVHYRDQIRNRISYHCERTSAYVEHKAAICKWMKRSEVILSPNQAEYRRIASDNGRLHQ